MKAIPFFHRHQPIIFEVLDRKRKVSINPALRGRQEQEGLVEEFQVGRAKCSCGRLSLEVRTVLVKKDKSYGI